MVKKTNTIHVLLKRCNCSEVAINTCCLWRKNMIQGANPIAEGDFAWICDRNYEGTE